MKVNHKTKQYYRTSQKTINTSHETHILLTNSFVAKPTEIQRGSDKTLVELLRDVMLQRSKKTRAQT